MWMKEKVKRGSEEKGTLESHNRKGRTNNKHTQRAKYVIESHESSDNDSRRSRQRKRERMEEMERQRRKRKNETVPKNDRSLLQKKIKKKIINVCRKK